MSTIREWVEWDWVYLSVGGGRLHHLAVIEDESVWAENESFGSGTTTCGRAGTWAIPGFISRMGAPRCRRCCDRLGIKQGVGSPKNDADLHGWVEKRLATA